MGLLTPAQLTQGILQHGLLDGEPRDSLPDLSGRFQDARELAQDLMRRDWLTPFQINQLFLGRGKDLTLGPYLFLERLGEGGMGQVFKARQRNLGRVVALKVIRKDIVQNAKVIKRFEREMRAVGQMRHPNIVHAHDADQIEGVAFISMEFIDGIDLAKQVKQSGPLTVTQACDYIRQAALGLQHAFEQGLVHRDIKPANLILTRPGADRHSSAALTRPGAAVTKSSGVHSRADNSPASGATPRPDPVEYPWGLIKILDLGLARWTDAANERTHLTQLGSLMGTPDFIAPEQARNCSTCDIRADIYSLGCTFYFLLTGQAPFPTGTLTEKLLHHQMDQAEAVEQVRRRRLLERTWVQVHGKPSREALEVPAAVTVVLRKMMAKKPEERQQTPGEAAEQLQAFLAAAVRIRKQQPVSSTQSVSTVLGGQTAAPLKAKAKPIIELPTTKPGRTRRKLALATAGIALVCGVVFAAVSNNGSRPEASPPPAARPRPARRRGQNQARGVADADRGTQGQRAGD